MKKLTALLLCLVLLVSLLAGCGSSKQNSAGDSDLSGELVLYTWEGMFPQEVLDGFTEETGVTINYANFDYDETMLSKLEAAEGGDYDLIIADDYIIETVIEEGLAQKLDKSKIENYDSINPVYQGQFYDPDDEYTVPYGAGVQTIVYDPALVSIDIDGYEDLWDPSLAKNVGVTENFRVINGMALKVLGESYNTNDVATIEAAGAKLLGLAPNIRLIKDDNLQDDIISGEVAAAVMYTSQVTMAKLERPELEVVFPKEGIGFGIMGMFVPSEAPNAAAAHAFIDYILRPEVSAQSFEWLGYYCTNKDADALIDESMRDFLTLPGDLDTSNMEMIGNISAEAVEAHDKAWTEFKTATE